MKVEQVEYFETSEQKIHAPGKHQKEIIKHSQND
jgi:hypothetical protein